MSVFMFAMHAQTNGRIWTKPWHGGSLHPGAQLRGVKVGGGPQGAEPPGENPIFQPGAKRRHGNSAARCRAERRLGINNLRT